MTALPSKVGVYFLGIASAVAASLALLAALMRPPLADLMELALSFTATGVASAALGYISFRLGWWRRLARLSHSLALGYLAAAGLTLLNVWISARLMFLSDHDLTLAGLLLLFAAGVSVSFGVFFSHSITRALARLVEAAERLSQEDFTVRVPVEGRDEVARLAQEFNRAAQRLATANDRARRLEASRREFVAWTSHDLRTPLAALLAMVDALVDGVVADPEDVARYLWQCQTEIGRMDDLIDGLFELARIDAGELQLVREPCSLTDLVSDTLQGVTALAQAQGISVIGGVDPSVDPVWMAPREIGRVLANLVENALRHTPRGGRVELRATLANPQAGLAPGSIGRASPRRCRGASAAGTVGGARMGSGDVSVRVSDSGEGIATGDLPRIFERFYRGEASRSREGFSRGGAGLGLAIAKGFVEAHGGEIWAESQPGQGTSVVFRIPRRAPEAQGGQTQ